MAVIRAYRMIPAAERLDGMCQAFAATYGPAYPDIFPDEPPSEYEQRAWKEGRLEDGRYVAVNLTYRTPEQQRWRRLAAPVLREIRTGGNPSVEINQYMGLDTAMARYIFDRTVGLVVVNGYEFPEHEVRPLEDEEREALRSSVDTLPLCNDEYMRQLLLPAGQERLIADLAGLIALDISA